MVWTHTAPSKGAAGIITLYAVVREDIAIRAVHAGSVLTFSPWEVERHLQHAVEECRIMRSRGNIYFV